MSLPNAINANKAEQSTPPNPPLVKGRARVGFDFAALLVIILGFSGLWIGLFAFVVRLIIILNVPNGFSWDMGGWIETTKHIVANGFQNAYSKPLMGNLYPPGFFYPLWLTGQIYRVCCSPDFATDTPTLDFLMRLGPIIADSFIAILVYRIALLWTDARRAIIAGIAYALNPAALTTTAWMSMIGDPYYLLPTLLSLFAALTRRFAWSAALIVIAILIKPQALAFAPLILFLILTMAKPRQVLNALVAATVSGWLVMAPFIVAGKLDELAQTVERMRGAFPFIHVWADNAWYLLSGGQDPWDPLFPNGINPNGPPQPFDTNLFLGVIEYRMIGLAAFGTLYLATLYWLAGRAKPQNAIAASALIALGFFILSTRMHENYSFPVFALLSILGVSRDWRYAFLLIVTTGANLVDWQIFDDFFANKSELLRLHMANSVVFVSTFALLLLVARADILREPRDLVILGTRVQIISPRFLIALATPLILAALAFWAIFLR